MYNSDYSGITHNRVLSGDLYAQRLQKLIYLYLFITTDCFMKISLQSLEQILDFRCMYDKYIVQKASICQVTAMLATSKNILFPAGARVIIKVLGHQYR